MNPEFDLNALHDEAEDLARTNGKQTRWAKALLFLLDHIEEQDEDIATLRDVIYDNCGCIHDPFGWWDRRPREKKL